MESRPNIFSIATEELSQDGFITWLLQWADAENAKYNKQLNAKAQAFLRMLISSQYDAKNLIIEKVNACRQQEHIDILVKVNDRYVVVIEDKKDAIEHGNQLENYKKIATEPLKAENLMFIYLKTGNESLVTQRAVEKKGYAFIGRKKILDLFADQETSNDIVGEFVEYLRRVEERTNAYVDFKSLTTDWYAAQGLYRKLQEFKDGSYLKETAGEDFEDQIGDWGYVPNQTGGFLGFWYHRRKTENFTIHIQIENAVDRRGIKLVVKSTWGEESTSQPITQTLYRVLDQLQPIARRHGLTFSKPVRFRPGKTSTVAVVDNVFSSNPAGVLDFDKLAAALTSLEQTIDEYCGDVRTT